MLSESIEHRWRVAKVNFVYFVSLVFNDELFKRKHWLDIVVESDEFVVVVVVVVSVVVVGEQLFSLNDKAPVCPWENEMSIVGQRLSTLNVEWHVRISCSPFDRLFSSGDKMLIEVRFSHDAVKFRFMYAAMKARCCSFVRDKLWNVILCAWN